MLSLKSWLRRSGACGVIAGAFLLAQSTTNAQERGAEPPRLNPPVPVAETPAAPEMPTVLPPGETRPAVLAPNATSAWLDKPAYRASQRVGFFGVPPTGCGYYSVQDLLTGTISDKAPKSGYPAFGLNNTPNYDANFRYVDDPKSPPPDFFDELHRIHFGDNWLFGTGGEFRWRHMHEFSSRFTGRTNDYELLRGRIYGDLWYKDTFRIFAEVITAQTISQDLPPLRIDENRFDFQNLFVEMKVGEFACNPAYVRVGRQELLLGSQRMISPPDWANTRRVFQGVRGFWTSEKLDIDLFWMQPVLPNNTGMSSVDYKQNFYGAWATYRPEKTQAIDLYYLFLDNANTAVAAGLATAPTSLHTLGTRYHGSKEGFLWDLEGMLQLGQRGSQPIRAGAATAGVGYNAKDLPMNPTVWAYYDWASGDHSPNAGNYSTFNQLFPLGHHYFGWLDLVGRQNIRDVNAHLYLYPAKWLTLNAQYHFFNLDSARDALYGTAGQPLRVNLGGNAGGRVGQELDLIANIHLTKRSDLLFGYSKLNAGDFISNTGNGRSPELWYMMYNVRW